MTYSTGYTVLIVGGGSGIGSAAAGTLAAAGVQVYLADRDHPGAERTADGLRASGGRATALYADVCDEDSLAEAVRQVTAEGGRLHAVINTAGIQGPLGLPSHQVTLPEFEAVVRVNLTGALAITRAVIPHMLEHSYGRIAHVASIAGKEGNPNMVAYSASKAGLIGMVKAQGKEYARHGIVVNALAPAVIQTPFLDTQPASVIEYMRERIPMGRFGTVEETAEMLSFMVSPACSFTTGFTFDASGGRATY